MVSAVPDALDGVYRSRRYGVHVRCFLGGTKVIMLHFIESSVYCVPKYIATVCTQ